MRESHNSLRGCIPSNLKPPSKPYLSKFPPPYNSNGLGLRLLQSGNRETLKNIGVTVCTWKQKAQSVCPWTAGAVALNSVRYEEPCGTSSSTCAMCTMAFLKRAIKNWSSIQIYFISEFSVFAYKTGYHGGSVGPLWILASHQIPGKCPGMHFSLPV